MRRILRSYELSLETLMENTILKAAMSCAALMFSVVFFISGMDWITEGYGLHPLISFPMMLICILLALLISFSEDVSEKEWEI
jgi:hypothetical protein